MPANTRIRLRRGTASEWTTANPVLLSGEVGFETDTGLVKVGDGTTAWSSLAYNFTGPTGLQGATGAQGTTGIQGTTGLQGATGLQGSSGANGAQGTTGATGATGSQGLTGLQGTTGATGLQGTAGQNGSQGTTGLQGATGATGLQGFTGAQGATGLQGTSGADGTQGTIGLQGITGLQGTTGLQGADGLQGLVGATGAAPGLWYRYDSTTTKADPGAGLFRFNSTTAASITEMYISETDYGAVGRATAMNPWDDSTSSIKGQLVITAINGNLVVLNITGAIVDEGTYRTVPVTHVSGNLGATTNDRYIGFTRTGDGYLNIPQTGGTTGAYTLVAGDSGEHIYSTATRTITIPANSSVPFEIGTAITFISGSGATTTIAITTDTLILAGTGSTGSRTLSAHGVATAIKVASTTWYISGNGLT